MKRVKSRKLAVISIQQQMLKTEVFDDVLSWQQTNCVHIVC